MDDTLKDSKHLSIWLDSLVRYWVLLAAAGALLWAAISRDMSQDYQILTLNKYGTESLRSYMDLQTKTNQGVLLGLERLNQSLEDVSRRVTRLEDRK